MRSRGFTMIELLVVMGVISLLLGLGVGFLQRGDTSVDQTLSILRTELRGAALTARTHAAPTQVIITPAREAMPSELHSQRLVPLASWHLEPDEIYLNPALRPELSGHEAAGRFGRGLRADLEVDQPMFSVPINPALFPLREGFVLRLDVKVERAEPMIVLRLGDGVSLEVNGDLVPELRMVRTVGGRRGPGSIVVGERPVPLGRWCTLEVLHDGSELVLGVDEIEARQEAVGSLYQTSEDRLEISPANGPVHGIVDEISLFGYERGEPRMLPVEIDLVGLPPVLRFGRLGRLPAALPFQVRSETGAGTELNGYTIDPGGVVR